MHKPMNRLCMIAASMMGAGLLCAGTAFAVAGFDIRQLNTDRNYEQKSYSFDAHALTAISISGTSSDVRIVGDDDRAGTMLYEFSDGTDYAITLTDQGELRVVYRDNRHWYQRFGISTRHVLTMYLPTNMAARMDVEVGSGDIYMERLQLKNDIQAVSQSGDIILKTVSGGDVMLRSSSGNLNGHSLIAQGRLTLQSSSGQIRLNQAEVDGAAVLSSHSGDQKITELKANSTLEASASSGDLQVIDVSAQGVSLKTHSGNIRLDRLAGHDMALQTTSGDIRGTLTGSSDEYTLMAQSVSGRIRIPQTGRGERFVQANTTSGNIELSFSD